MASVPILQQHQKTARFSMTIVCCRHQLEGKRSDLAAAQKRQQELQGTVDAKEARLADMQAALNGLQDTVQSTRKELGTPLNSQLTPEEREQLKQLQEEIRQLQVIIVFIILMI